MSKTANLRESDEISRLGEILNSQIMVLSGFHILHKATGREEYRFAQPSGVSSVKELMQSNRHIYPINRRVKAAYLLRRIYKNSQEPAEREYAEIELKKCELGRIFMHF